VGARAPSCEVDSEKSFVQREIELASASVASHLIVTNRNLLAKANSSNKMKLSRIKV